MPNPRDRIAQVRDTVRAGARNVLRQGKYGGSASEDVFARARPEKVELTENYFCNQEISKSPFNRMSAPPAGKIEISVPYDGDEYFTREACEDVARAVGGNPDGPSVDARIGHLVLTDHGKTDLAEVLKLHNRYSSVPIAVPVGDNGPGELSRLHADKSSCVIEYEYAPKPDHLKLVPIDVEFELLDPDTVGLLDTNATDGVQKKFSQQVSFRSCLWLHISVRIVLPHWPGQPDIEPVISRLSLDWPTITSMRALHLTVLHDDEDQSKPISYNPVNSSIEWADVKLHQEDSDNDQDYLKDTRTYRSDLMELWIKQPGELYKKDYLDARIEVEIPGLLLSGTQTRLFNGLGALEPERQPESTSRITTETRLYLEDTFAKRILSPNQHLYFDEVIPEASRIDDIHTALQVRGFDIYHEETQETEKSLQHFLRARRSEGPETMDLWIRAEGQRNTTERENHVPGGHTFKSTLDSGELKVYMIGLMPRASRELTHEMNALQQALRDRFDRVRAKR